jgi:hypothetical protein
MSTRYPQREEDQDVNEDIEAESFQQPQNDLGEE